MSSSNTEVSIPLSVNLGLDIGPPLSSRQRKAAAVFTLSQLLALAELRATSLRNQHPSSLRRINGALAASRAPGARAYAGRASVVQLRHWAAKQQAEEADTALRDAAPLSQRPRTNAAGSTTIAMKRIAVVPPLGTPLPASAGAAVQLGCHLARRCGTARTAAAGPSSLARVYGSRLRVALLPDDYAECFVGLEPVRQPDVDEQELIQAAQRRVVAAATTSTAGLTENGSPAAPPTGGDLLGSAGVGEEMTHLLFAANAGVQPLPTIALAPSVPDAPAYAVAGLATPAAASLMAAFETKTDGVLSFTIQPYGDATFLGGFGCGAPSGAPGAAAAGAAAGLALINSQTDKGSGKGMDADTALGAAYDDLHAVVPLSQAPPPPHLGQALAAGGCMPGFGVGTTSNEFPYSAAGGELSGLAGGVIGFRGVGLGSGGGGAVSGPAGDAAAVDDDDGMVEEF